MTSDPESEEFDFQEWLDNGGRDAIRDVQKYFRRRRYLRFYEGLWLYLEQWGIVPVMSRVVPLLIWIALHQLHGTIAYVGVFDLTR